MDYNDFPNLDDNDYLILNTMYQQSSFDRTETTSKILILLNRIKSKIDGSINLYNFSIVSSLNELRETISIQLNNLSKENNPTQSTAVTSTSIFSILKDLNELTLTYLDWTQHEKKDYYKILSLTYMKSILTCETKIYNNLCNSYIKTFKYM